MQHQTGSPRWGLQKKRPRPPSINDQVVVVDDDVRLAGYREQILTTPSPAESAIARTGTASPLVETVDRVATDSTPPLGTVVPHQSQAVEITVSVRLLETPTPESVVSVVTSHWGNAREQMLLCGRYLARARDMFRGRFSTEIIPKLPFERATADKLAKVAILVDAGVLPVERLPPNYSTAFLLLTLDKSDLAKAEERNLVRPNVSRKEVEAFRSELRAARAHSAVLLQELRGRRLKLLSRRDALDEEIRQVDEKLAMVDGDGVVIDDGPAVDERAVGEADIGGA